MEMVLPSSIGVKRVSINSFVACAATYRGLQKSFATQPSRPRRPLSLLEHGRVLDTFLCELACLVIVFWLGRNRHILSRATRGLLAVAQAVRGLIGAHAVVVTRRDITAARRAHRPPHLVFGHGAFVGALIVLASGERAKHARIVVADAAVG